MSLGRAWDILTYLLTIITKASYPCNEYKEEESCDNEAREE